MEICILGSGTWGTALSQVLSDNNHNIAVWSRKVPSNKIESIKYISDINLVINYDVLIIAIPSHAIYEVFKTIELNKDIIIINCSKGFDPNTYKPISKLLNESFKINIKNYFVLSGPSHSEEVIRRIPTAMVLSSKNIQKTKIFQKELSTKYFRIYSSDDVIGLEIAGLCKNIISIAAGICIGLKYGDNTIAALISRGINEITKFGAIFKADYKTFYGLGGIGDLSVTSFSNHSRNRKFGIHIGNNKDIAYAQNKVGMVVEGLSATEIVYLLSKKHKINMPIVNEVYSILFNNKCPKSAINELMSRELKLEFNKHIEVS